MTVELTRADDVLVLAVTGDLDAGSWEVPVTAAHDALAGEGVRQVVVDLAGVTFLDSSGLGCLVRIRNLCHDTGVRLTLRGVRRSVRKLLVATGLDTVFDVADVSDPRSTGSDLSHTHVTRE